MAHSNGKATTVADWIALDDVPEAFGIKKDPGWLRRRWRRDPGAPRPSKVSNGVYTVRRAHEGKR